MKAFLLILFVFQSHSKDVQVETEDFLHELRPEFISFSIDTALAIGGRWWTKRDCKEGFNCHIAAFDLKNPRFRRLAHGLAPAIFRVGGTEADKMYYNLYGEVPENSPPDSLFLPAKNRYFDSTLEADEWRNIQSFLKSHDGFKLLFTAHAGPGTRKDTKGDWSSENFKKLLQFAAKEKSSVFAWEFSNEPNIFGRVFKNLDKSVNPSDVQIDGATCAKNFRQFQKTVSSEPYFSNSLFAGPTVAYFPSVRFPSTFLMQLFGEYNTAADAFFDWNIGRLAQLLYPTGQEIPQRLPWRQRDTKPILKSFLKNLKRENGELDIITWHYYPTQSSRCEEFAKGSTSILATPENMLSKKTRSEVDIWATQVNEYAERYGVHKEVWMGETGPAQCGGGPGLSDRFVSGIWWMDHLGRLAKANHKVVIRQSLIGSDYELLQYENNFEPNPDYWNSWLWKQFMGERVLKAKGSTKNLRFYSHCSSKDFPKGSVTLLVINANLSKTEEFQLPNLGKAISYAIRGEKLGKDVLLNGHLLKADANGQLPKVPKPKEASAKQKLPAISYNYYVFPDADAEACL